MPIYEFACPKCRIVFNFLSRRVDPGRQPSCPKCGNRKMVRQMSGFAALSGSSESSGAEAGPDDAGGPVPDFDDPKVARAMSEMESDMASIDENNPKHMAHMMRKMKDILPPGAIPKGVDAAIKRLEAGEDPEKIEADMGDVFGEMMGGAGEEGSGAGAGGYSHDSGMYDY
jgi:putative FmdB family regulatory protein